MLYFSSFNHRPLRYVSSGNLISNDGFIHPSRCLDTFVLLVGVEGVLHIHQEQRKYTVGPGQFLLLHPERHHAGTQASKGRLSYFWCHFTTEEDYQLIDEKNVKQYMEENFLHDSALRDIYFLPEYGQFQNNSSIILEYRRLVDYSQQKLYSSSIVDYMLSLLAMELTQETLQDNSKSELFSRSLYSLIDLQEYIRTNYHTALSVTKLASMFGYNPNYLSTVFKKVTGMPLTRHINQLRINNAKTLLLNTSTPVCDIALEVGYNDSKYFVRLFKRFEGISPTQFRNIYFRKHINIQ